MSYIYTHKTPQEGDQLQDDICKYVLIQIVEFSSKSCSQEVHLITGH